MNKFLRLLSIAAILVMSFGATVKADAVYNHTPNPVTVTYYETSTTTDKDGWKTTTSRNSTYTIGSGGNQCNPNTSIPKQPKIKKGTGTITQRGRDWFIN